MRNWLGVSPVIALNFDEKWLLLAKQSKFAISLTGSLVYCNSSLACLIFSCMMYWDSLMPILFLKMYSKCSVETFRLVAKYVTVHLMKSEREIKLMALLTKVGGVEVIESLYSRTIVANDLATKGRNSRHCSTVKHSSAAMKNLSDKA